MGVAVTPDLSGVGLGGNDVIYGKDLCQLSTLLWMVSKTYFYSDSCPVYHGLRLGLGLGLHVHLAGICRSRVYMALTGSFLRSLG